MTPETWLKHILEGLVSHPDALLIQEKEDEMGTLFTITAHKEDQGMLIGRKGEHVNALRVILRSYGYKVDKKISLKVKAD